MITLPTRVHNRDPIVDPAETFPVIDAVLDRQNELAGFDGSKSCDRPTRLRMHYLVDFRVSKADREGFYMSDQFIGMLDDNSAELTDPEKLKRE